MLFSKQKNKKKKAKKIKLDHFRSLFPHEKVNIFSHRFKSENRNLSLCLLIEGVFALCSPLGVLACVCCEKKPRLSVGFS